MNEKKSNNNVLVNPDRLRQQFENLMSNIDNLPTNQAMSFRNQLSALLQVQSLQVSEQLAESDHPVQSVPEEQQTGKLTSRRAPDSPEGIAQAFKERILSFLGSGYKVKTHTEHLRELDGNIGRLLPRSVNEKNEPKLAFLVIKEGAEGAKYVLLDPDLKTDIEGMKREVIDQLSEPQWGAKWTLKD